MSTIDSVGVALDGPGKKILNFKHAGIGAGGADLYGQAAHFADPSDPTHAAKITNALPAANADGLVIRSTPPAFDSGMVNVPSTLTSITAVDTLGDTLFVSNQTDFVQWITVTNAAGTGIYLNQRQIAPRDAFSISFGKVKIVGGIKWQASADSTVQAQMTGWQ
jgi:hypothetical protein